MAGNCEPVSRSDVFILGTAGLRECALGGGICIGTWGGGGHRAENIDRQSDGQQRQEILTDAK
jgi:hypothetical protein